MPGRDGQNPLPIPLHLIRSAQLQPPAEFRRGDAQHDAQTNTRKRESRPRKISAASHEPERTARRSRRRDPALHPNGELRIGRRQIAPRLEQVVEVIGFRWLHEVTIRRSPPTIQTTHPGLGARPGYAVGRAELRALSCSTPWLLAGRSRHRFAPWDRLRRRGRTAPEFWIRCARQTQWRRGRRPRSGTGGAFSWNRYDGVIWRRASTRSADLPYTPPPRYSLPLRWRFLSPNRGAVVSPRRKKSGQALHGTGRTSLPLLPSGPGGVHAPAHAWHLAGANHAPHSRRRNSYFPAGTVRQRASPGGQDHGSTPRGSAGARSTPENVGRIRFGNSRGRSARCEIPFQFQDMGAFIQPTGLVPTAARPAPRPGRRRGRPSTSCPSPSPVALRPCRFSSAMPFAGQP